VADRGAGDIRTRMRRALTAALKARDQRAVTALRSALAAIDNAEAVDTANTPPAPNAHQGSGETPPGQGRPASAEAPSAGEGHPVVEAEIAGAALGVGAAEVERRTLTGAETQAIVRAEVDERRTAAHAYDHAGQPAHAARLRVEAEVLSAFLDDPGAGPGPDQLEAGPHHPEAGPDGPGARLDGLDARPDET
jgi:uncharacterized protein YqeY